MKPDSDLMLQEKNLCSKGNSTMRSIVQRDGMFPFNECLEREGW